MDTAPPPSAGSIPPSAPSADLVRAWPPAAQWVTAFLLGVTLTLLGVNASSYLRWGAQPTELLRDRDLSTALDLNRATPAELRQLAGVGEVLVQRIVEYRQLHGRFQSVEELRNVQGVGPALFGRIRPYLYVDYVPTSRTGAPTDAPAESVSLRLATPAAPPTNVRSSGRKEAQLTELIDVNQASRDELQGLPGIGPALSQRILDERARRPFHSVEELRRVSGIGPKVLEKLRPYVTVGSGPQRVAQN